jgi:hypothetical protein
MLYNALLFLIKLGLCLSITAVVTVLVFADQASPSLFIPVVSLAILDNGLTLGMYVAMLLLLVMCYICTRFNTIISVTLSNQQHQRMRSSAVLAVLVCGDTLLSLFACMWAQYMPAQCICYCCAQAHCTMQAAAH